MGNFGVNFNFDYGNLKLDKLFEDANKSGKANLFSNQQSVASNYNTNTANSYGGTNSSGVETMDLSVKVKNDVDESGVDMLSTSNPTANATQTESGIENSNVEVSQPNNASDMSSGNTMNQSNIDATENNNVNINNSSSNGTTATTSNNSQTDVSINTNSGNGSGNNGVNIDKQNVDISSNNANESTDINTNNGMNINTNSNSSNSNVSTNPDSNINVNGGDTSSNNTSIDVSLDFDKNNDNSSASYLNIKNGKVYVTSTDNSGNPINIEIDVDDYINNLKSFGFNETDIKRIIDGKITPEALMDEIQKDSDTTRKQAVMESSYLKSFGLDFDNMEEVNNAILNSEQELKKLTDERNKADNRELDGMMAIIVRLKQGETFEDVIDSEIVCWKYIDENGNVCYTENDPYQFGMQYDSNGNPYQYEALNFVDMYGESDYYKELEGILTENTVTSFFGGETRVIHQWEYTEEQEKYFDEIAEKYSDNISERENKIKDLDAKITELQQQKATYEYIYEYINKEISYYMQNVDVYISKDDFEMNSNFNSSCLDKVEEISEKYSASSNLYNYQYGPMMVQLNNKEDLVKVLACMINEEGSISNGLLKSGNNFVQIYSNDDIFDHCQQWLPFITEEEVKIFNYIYNTDGVEAAYNYLEDISDELDNRWLANKTQEDQEFASDHPILASVGSIVVTPIEGISAACYSMNSYFTGEKIRRADVYSAGDVWRAQVSQDIAENYGEGWAFAYNTGMSMADSASLIAVSVATGGVATPVLSATLMGSRAYVSTLNDALDRGLSDSTAIGLAMTSAVVETAMENYSLGHLLNLEENLGKNTVRLAGKIASNIENETVANLVTKGFYLSASALSQGLAEGEEEFATEILNYVADIFIAKDLSNYTQSINQYLANGYSENQALISTMIDFSGQALQAFLGGFASGICFGTFGGITSTIKTSNGIAKNMYNDLYGKNSAQQFTSALETNLQQLEEYQNALDLSKKGQELTQEQIQLLNNGTIEMQSAINLKQQMNQKLSELGISIKNIFSQNISSSNNLEENSETKNISSDMMKVYDLLVEQGIIENFISKAKGENGKIAGVELFKMLGYDVKPTVATSENFDVLSQFSKYGTLVREISGANSQTYVDQFINGEMYVGGTHVSIKGTGIYTGFGLSADQIASKYATNAGTENGGSIIEMFLNQDAKVIEYSDIVSEQNQILDSLSLEFSKYNPEIKNFDTLLANLNSITDSADLQKAKFLTNFLMDTGYYAALRGYDAIADSFDNYLTVLNRGKLTVKDNLNENGVDEDKIDGSISEIVDNSVEQQVSSSLNIDDLLSELDKKNSDLEEENDRVNVQNFENINNPKIAQFIAYFDRFSEEAKSLTGKTDEELPYLLTFRNKVISCGSIEEILNNFDNFTPWELRRLINPKSPILADLFNNQKVLDYVTQNMSNKDILDLSSAIPSHPLIVTAFLSLTDEEVEEIGSYTIFNKFQKFSLDIQKQFVDLHTDFFSKELRTVFWKNLNTDSFTIIFDKVGSLEFLKDNSGSIASLSSEIQEMLFNKYMNDIYNGTQRDFMKLAKQINNPEYQAQFIKNSPFYSEIISSTKFSELLRNLKSKDFILELIKSPDAYSKMINNSGAFANFISLLSLEEQQEYKAIAKEKIMELNTTTDREVLIWAHDEIYTYISCFNEQVQNELFNDEDIANSFSTKTVLKLNDKYNGKFIDKLKELITGNFDSESAKLLFEPAIYQLMDQETINRAANALTVYEYGNLAKLGNQEAINILIDKMIANNFSEVNNWSSSIIKIYEAADEVGKQKIADNISFSALISTVGSYNGEQFADILVQRLTANDAQTGLKVEYLRKISQYNQESYEKIIKCLSKKQKLVAFNYKNVVALGIEQDFIEIFRESPELINYMDNFNKNSLAFLSLLTEQEDIEKYYSNITIKTLLDVSNSKDFEKLDKVKVKNILENELSEYTFRTLGEFDEFANILTYYSLDEQLEILNSLEIGNKYFLLLNGNIKTRDTKFEMIKMIMNDPEFRTSISDDNIENFTRFFDSLEAEYIDYIVNNANNHFLGFILTFCKRNDLNIKFNEMINNNVLILNEFEYSDAELIYGNLSEENRVLLDTKISNILSNIGNSKIINLLDDATIVQKSAFIEAYNNGLINDEKLDLLAKIKNKNKFVLSTFNYSLFDETIYKFGDNLLTKLSKYYDVVEQIVELKKTPEKFNLFAQFVINDNTSTSTIVADQKMSILLNYLLENDISTDFTNITTLEELETARNIILKQIDQFSILDPTGNEQVRDRSIIVPENFTLKDYDSKLAQKCDALLKEAQNVTEVQNLIFNKYFSISIEDATELFRMYGTRFASIKGLDSDGIATTYLENMNNILNMSTMEEAIDFYNSFNTTNRYNMNETLNIINEIKQIYTKSLKSTLFNPTEITGYVEYEGKQIPIYQPKGDFQMLIQSTYTNYGGMPMINDNYFDSWNLSSRTANHGICCSLISNDNMGMALVKGPGVVIGFNNFSDEQMNMMAPYDIYTRNDGYVIKCQRPLLYLPGQEVMNETRHTHNEFNLERTNLTDEGELANIQPNYVVVFEQMSDKQKQNAYKASVEFNVPLVYINKDTLAATESAKIDNLIGEYKNTNNVELLKQILTLHENNRSGYRNPTDSALITQYFTSDRISAVLTDAIENCSSKEELTYIKNILEDEIRKFDVTLEATNRMNEIDIDAKGLVEKIGNKIKIIEDIEKTKDMNFQLQDEDPDATARLISIGNLIDIIKDNDLFAEFNLYDEYRTSGRKLISSFNKTEYLEAFMQLYNTIKNNNYDLGFNEQQTSRLELLYNEAIEKIDISKIQYSEFLPDDIKLKVMFRTNEIYNYGDLSILYNYFFDNYVPDILYNNPTLIYSDNFKFFVDTFGRYISSNSNILNEFDIQFWDNLVNSKKDCENIIIQGKIDIGEQEFNNFVHNIYDWNQENKEYVEYFLSKYSVDVNNLNYSENMPDNLKLQIMLRDNQVYDRELLISEVNKEILNKLNTIVVNNRVVDPNFVFNDLFLLYFCKVSDTLTQKEMLYTLTKKNCQFLFSNCMKQICEQNIDISESNFKKFLMLLNLKNSKIQDYVNNYMKNHINIDLSDLVDKIIYSDGLPISIKNKILFRINVNYDGFISQGGNNVYGADQNATAKYINIKFKNLDWLSDDNDFIQYLVSKRRYDQKSAQTLLENLKQFNGRFYDARGGSIIIEYIYDKCARENRFDVLDVINQSFTIKYGTEINRLGSKLVNLGMSYSEALRTLCALDSTGCCSYAATANSILLSYKGKSQAFEKDFGYPMYVYVNGQQEFNSSELILDMYMYLNSNNYVNNNKEPMFLYNSDGSVKLNNLITNNQVYLSGLKWRNGDAINSFLQSKNSKLNFKIDGGMIYCDGYRSSTQNEINSMKEIIINYLKKNQNNSVKLGIYRTEENGRIIPIRFMNSKNEVFKTTENWNEGDGHAVCVTGVLDDYFIVSSWGKRLFIPISDFVGNNFNLVFNIVEGIE